MRIGNSSPKYHLFHNLRVKESASWKCGHPIGSVKNFFLEFPLFAVHRHRLFQVLHRAIVSDQLILNGRW